MTTATAPTPAPGVPEEPDSPLNEAWSAPATAAGVGLVVGLALQACIPGLFPAVCQIASFVVGTARWLPRKRGFDRYRVLLFILAVTVPPLLVIGGEGLLGPRAWRFVVHAHLQGAAAGLLTALVCMVVWPATRTYRPWLFITLGAWAASAGLNLGWSVQSEEMAAPFWRFGWQFFASLALLALIDAGNRARNDQDLGTNSAGGFDRPSPRPRSPAAVGSPSQEDSP